MISYIDSLVLFPLLFPYTIYTVPVEPWDSYIDVYILVPIAGTSTPSINTYRTNGELGPLYQLILYIVTSMHTNTALD